MLRHLLSVLHVLTFNGSIYYRILYNNKENCHWQRIEISWNRFNWTKRGEEEIRNSPSDASYAGICYVLRQNTSIDFQKTSRNMSQIKVCTMHVTICFNLARFAKPVKCFESKWAHTYRDMRMFCQRTAALNRVRCACAAHLQKIGRKRWICNCSIFVCDDSCMASVMLMIVKRCAHCKQYKLAMSNGYLSKR